MSRGDRTRLVALVEATTFLALLAAVVSYRVFDGPDLTEVLGPVHGLAFVAYVVAVLLAREERGWGVGRTAVIVLAAVVPFGGYLAAARLMNDQSAAGGRVSPDPGP